jgi:lipopolysaccharide transport system permease protein
MAGRDRSDRVTESLEAQRRGEPAELQLLDRPWVENRAAVGWLPHIDLQELWSYRELALALARKDLSVRYKQTFFGIAWAVLQPLLAVVVFTVIFGRLAGLPADGIPYPVFAYAGAALWFYVSSSVSAAALSLVDNRELVSKTYFPRGLAPLAAVAPGLVDLLVALTILGVLMGAYGVAPGPEVVLLPAWVAAAAVIAFSVGLFLSALNVKYRDVKYALAFGIQLWFFGSPVVYASSLVTGDWRFLYALNPVVTVLDGFRWSVLNGPAPGLEALVSVATVACLLVGGLVYFHRVERYAADLI